MPQVTPTDRRRKPIVWVQRDHAITPFDNLGSGAHPVNPERWRGAGRDSYRLRAPRSRFFSISRQRCSTHREERRASSGVFST